MNRKEVINKMRKILALVLVMAMLVSTLVLCAPVAYAASSANITVTATGTYLDISVSGGDWTLNSGDPIDTSDWYYTNPLGETTDPSDPVVDAECTNTLTNNSSVAINVTLEWPDMTGTGDPWVNSDDGSNGSMIFGAKAQASGANWSTAIVAKESSPYNTLISNLAASGTKKFVYGFYSPSAFTDANSKSATTVLQASEYT